MLQCSSGGGVLLGPEGGVLLGPGGGSPWSRGGSPWSGGGGLCLVRGGSLETPPVNRITDTCKNITLATTSLRPVNISPLLRLHYLMTSRSPSTSKQQECIPVGCVPSAAVAVGEGGVFA